MAVQRGTITGGYRDPHKAMTIKALQDRAKEAQAAFAASGAAEPVSSPWQGAANMLGVVNAGLGARHADQAEADSRAQLAQIMAGVKPQGATQGQLAEVGQYDPELAKALREELATKLNLEDTQAQQTSERLGQQGFTTSERIGQQGFTTSERLGTEAEASRLHEDTQAEGRTTAATLAETQDKQAQRDAAIAKEKARLDASLGSPEAKLTVGHEEGTVTDPQLATAASKAANEAAAAAPEHYNDPTTIKGPTGADIPVQTSTKTNKVDPIVSGGATTNVYSGSEGGEYAKKAEQVAAERHGKIVDAGNNAKYFIADIKRLGELGKAIEGGTGKGAELMAALGPYAQMAGVDMKEYGLDAAQAFRAITDRLAPQMRPEGSGSSSNYDAQQFLSSLPALGRTPEGNKIIQDTFTAIEQTKIAAAQIAQRALLSPDDPNYLDWKKVDAQIAALPDPFELYNKSTGAGTPAGDTGGVEAPEFDPAIDKEGNTGTDDQGNTWKVIGGKWVIQKG